ncbi:MAG: hypothetical protein ABEJ43_01225 [Haloferacaceae archaeon]
MSADRRRVDLPGWSGAAKRRALGRVAERAFPATSHVSAFAAGDSVAGEAGNSFYDLLWALVDGSDVTVGVGPGRTEYGAGVVDTTPTARLLGGLPARSLGGDHDRVPGFEDQYDLPRARAADLVEAALFSLVDPRDAVVRFVAESRGIDLGSLHAYGRGVASDSRVDGDPTVETVVLRGSEPHDHPSLRERGGYAPRDTLSRLVRSGEVDLAEADVVVEDVQAGRALAGQVDRGNRLDAMRGRFYDDGALAGVLAAVDDHADRDASEATTRASSR